MEAFHYPTPGTKVRITASGFDPEKTGIYVGRSPNGHCIVNIDVYDLLPEGSEHKTQVVSPELIKVL